MKNQKNKTKISAFAFVLMLTIAAILVALPMANAHTPPITVDTFCYVSIAPDTVGVTQPVLIAFWSNEIPPSAYGPWGDRWSFTVDVTKPDGTIDELGPIISDPVGGAWTLYTPTEVGTYTIVAKFPQQTSTGGLNNPLGRPAVYFPYAGLDVFVNDTYSASASDPVTLTVQQEPLPTYQETPLPTDYWTRPIYGSNRDWWKVAGQWLGGAANPGRINDYSAGPESSHILWSRSYWSGGIAGAEVGSVTYHSGTAYESFGAPSIILEGRVYYSMRGANKPSYGWYCVDLYTGETIYYENDTAIPGFAQIYEYNSPNQHGAFPYLWRTSGVTLPEGYTSRSGTQTWEMIDAYTGKSITKIANVSSSGTAAIDKIGSIVRYSLTTIGGVQYLRCWNTSQTATTRGTSGTSVWYWRPAQRAVHDGDTAWSLNVSITPAVQGSIREVRVEEYIIGGTTGSNNEQGIVQGNLWCLSLKPGEEGTLLWNRTFTPPPESAQDISRTAGKVSMIAVDSEDGVFLFQERLTRRWFAYSLDTMQQLWVSEPESQWNFYGMPRSIYQGKLFSYGYSGILTAYNITTGKILWNWTAPSVGAGQTPYTNTPLSMGCIADGKLYLYSTEHSVTQPIRRDARLFCVDAETGKMLWAITCWPSSSPIIADGHIVALDLFDNMIYCYGKGSSATTVSAPQIVPPIGSSVMITGTVTDDTPSGRYNVAGSLEFTLKGTPAIADESMDAWMEYMFHQQPIPMNAKGVEVVLETLDPNGNFYEIGRTTSDITGAYGCLFTPQVPGTYQIIARFEGSAAYGSSFAQTYMSIDEAPSPGAPIEPEPTTPEPTTTEPTTTEPTTPEPTTPEPTEPAEAPFITTEIAIIAAVAVACVIGAVSFWALRKRK